MNDVIKFYHNPMSRGATVHWMLEEVEAKYEVILLDFKKKEHKTPEYLSLNPMGKIPTISHRGTIITEAAAICAYLADIFPQNKLAPEIYDQKRGSYLRWLFFGASCVEPVLLDKMFSRPEIDKSSSGYGNYDEVMNTLEKQFEKGPFLLGDQFSAADVYMASQLGWGMMVKAIEPRPIIQRYLSLCNERPNYKRFNLKSQELIAQMTKA